MITNPIVQVDGVLSAIPPSRMTVAEAGFDVEHPPRLVGADVLAAIWGVTVSQIHRRIRRHDFDLFRVAPAIGPKKFSGILIARYLTGQPLVDIGFGRRTFNRKRSA